MEYFQFEIKRVHPNKGKWIEVRRVRELYPHLFVDYIIHFEELKILILQFLEKNKSMWRARWDISNNTSFTSNGHFMQNLFNYEVLWKLQKRGWCGIHIADVSMISWLHHHDDMEACNISTYHIELVKSTSSGTSGRLPHGIHMDDMACPRGTTWNGRYKLDTIGKNGGSIVTCDEASTWNHVYQP